MGGVGGDGGAGGGMGVFGGGGKGGGGGGEQLLGPQSPQSDPSWQTLYSAPDPPSSHSQSLL